MATSELGWPPSWGDQVRIAEDAEPLFRPGQLGEVVGLPDPYLPGGDRYLIEFENGAALEVPRRWIERP
jgi:hypothetical protein